MNQSKTLSNFSDTDDLLQSYSYSPIEKKSDKLGPIDSGTPKKSRKEIIAELRRQTAALKSTIDLEKEQEEQEIQQLRKLIASQEKIISSNYEQKDYSNESIPKKMDIINQKIGQTSLFSKSNKIEEPVFSSQSKNNHPSLIKTQIEHKKNMQNQNQGNIDNLLACRLKLIESPRIVRLNVDVSSFNIVTKTFNVITVDESGEKKEQKWRTDQFLFALQEYTI